MTTLVGRPAQASWLCRAGDEVRATDPVRAVDLYQQAVDCDPGNDRALSRLAWASQVAARTSLNRHEGERYWARARKALERAIALTPMNAYHHANLGRLHGERAAQGKIDARQAVTAWTAALEHEPRNVFLRGEAIRTMLAVGEHALALQWVEQSLEMYPDQGVFLFQLGAYHYAAGRRAEAVTWFEISLDADWRCNPAEKAHPLALLANMHLEDGQFALAARRACDASEAKPDWPTPYLLLSQICARQGQRDAETRWLNRLITVQPNHPFARQRLYALNGGRPVSP